MKKLITITLAICAGACAFAQEAAPTSGDTLEARLVSQRAAYVARGLSGYEMQKIWATESADCAAAFAKYKTANFLSYDVARVPNEEVSKDVAAQRLAIFNAVASYCHNNPENLKQLTTPAACMAACEKVVGVMSVENPAFYDEVKAVKFTFGGQRLPVWAIFTMASIVGDDETILNWDTAEAISWAPARYLLVLRRHLFDDLAKSKAVLTKCRATLIKAKKENSKEYQDVRALAQVVAEVSMENSL